LIEALFLKSQGLRLAVLESKGVIGGAWASVHLDGFGVVQESCHILQQYPGAYRFLNRVLGLRMTLVEPHPQFWVNGKKFHFNSPLRYLFDLYRKLFIHNSPNQSKKEMIISKRKKKLMDKGFFLCLNDLLMYIIN